MARLHSANMLFVLACLLATPSALADSRQQVQSEIDQVKLRIEQDRKQLQSLQNDLEILEKQVGNQSQEINRIQRQMAKHRREIYRLQQEKAAFADSQSKQQQELKNQVRLASQLDRDNYLKLLLNQQSPASIGRTLVYYEYLNQHRIDNLSHIEERLLGISQLEQQLKEENLAMEKLAQQHRRQREGVQISYANQQNLLGKIDQRLDRDNQRLEQLLQDLMALDGVIDKLPTNTAQAALNRKPGNLRTLKGRLPWPVSSKRIRAAFGSRRAIGDLRWDGIMIASELGEEVRNIHPGKVVFANWLRGFGLLVIIDHGYGYMSLYGHNQSLLKAEGDWVEAQEAIALAGNSGGQKEPGLYFEIRYQGKPDDPIRWCKR